jgi:hypothetical protein
MRALLYNHFENLTTDGIYCNKLKTMRVSLDIQAGKKHGLLGVT